MDGWLGLSVAIIIYLLAAILVIILSPIVIPETWTLRFHAMHASFLLSAFCLTIFSVMAFKVLPSDRCIRFACWSSLVWIQSMGWDVRTWRHLKILVESNNAVVVVNHQSAFDVFPFITVWNEISPMMMTFIGSEVKDYVLLGRGIRLVKSIHFLNRKQPREAMNTLISNTQAHFKQNEKNKIIIFPEGTRNIQIRQRGWKFEPFKPGAFRVAKSLNVPVIPVVVSPYYFLDQDRHYLAKGKTIASVLEPIHPGNESVEELRDKVSQLMQQEFFRLQDELSSENERVTTKID